MADTIETPAPVPGADGTPDRTPDGTPAGTPDGTSDGAANEAPARIPDEEPEFDRRRWIALAVVLTAGFMDLLDVTIVNVAIPAIQDELGASYASVQWIVAAYALSFAVVLITGGRLGDIFGRRRLFVIGMAGFTVASLLCGVSTGPGMLIGARAFQGLMAAIMVPQILAIVHVTFPPSERGKVFGMYGAIAGMAAISGPILGGLLIQGDVFGWGWRPIFLVNIPVGVLGVIATLVFVRESKAPHALKLDLVGVGLVTTGLLMLVFPLVQGRELGWPWWTYACMAGSLPLFAVFVWYERVKTRRDGSPLVELGLFRARSFSAGMLVLLLFQGCMAAFFLTWSLYQQLGLGWTPLHAGLAGVPFSIGVSVAAGMSIQFLVPKLGRNVLSLGALVLAAGMLVYAWAVDHYGTGISAWQMLVPLVVAGLGMGLLLPPLADTVLSGVDQKDAGSASGVLNAVNQLGNAIGIAVIGVVFFSIMTAQSGASADHAAPQLKRDLAATALPAPYQDQLLAGFKACVHDRADEQDPAVVPASCDDSRLKEIPQPIQDQVRTAVQKAGKEAGATDFARAFQRTLYGVAGGMGVVALLIFVLPRRIEHHEGAHVG
ncbi:MFS transporter [Yinghuangia seranimata]|uniref:MFS transporter n=1 Tax=Yinghuangia seranimata TaxID=408067 RepID=UPI00248CC74C|nr:MFS transporter [Yinghuangia seranimata]MDI2126730.1 MFS transporter [Yinghuangia seranimata]